MISLKMSILNQHLRCSPDTMKFRRNRMGRFQPNTMVIRQSSPENTEREELWHLQLILHLTGEEVWLNGVATVSSGPMWSSGLGENKMKKIINSTDNLIAQMMSGITKAYPENFRKIDDEKRALVYTKAPVEGKVGIATGGGSGHLPLFLGYIGENLIDGAAVGEVFSSPSVSEILEVTKTISCDKGVLYLYGNYGGDIMNFDMAADMAADEDIEVLTCIAADDVASAPPERKKKKKKKKKKKTQQQKNKKQKKKIKKAAQ
eukprot:TRINITY_DN8947_c0_g1_i3.p1 TRINITY_DN8947_c0_g1~~TRINITY_DN8947_c0_g1_i3.p1  ORF type:complete len:261 (-),score=53.23 TRINITY_DN8947_c0_g1_i3:44-826(-)